MDKSPDTDSTSEPLIGQNAEAIGTPEETESPEMMTMEDILYSARSCVVMIKPVVLAMLLSSLAVYYIQDPDIPAGEIGNRFYLIYSEPADTGGGSDSGGGGGSSDSGGSGESTGTKLGQSLLNSLAIIGYVIAMTFMLVLFLWLKCWKCLTGYMFLSGIMVLLMLSYSVLYTAIKRYNLPVSTLMFVLVLYNYTVVGMVAIFYQKGTPETVGQGYKVASSVMMAWQFYRIFPTWTSWALLFMLVLYDLCAVLTPCGPLNCFVKLMMQNEGEGQGFAMPLLLYETNVPDEEVEEAPDQDQPSRNCGSVESSGDSVHLPLTTMEIAQQTMQSIEKTSMETRQESGTKHLPTIAVRDNSYDEDLRSKAAQDYGKADQVLDVSENTAVIRDASDAPNTPEDSNITLAVEGTIAELPPQPVNPRARQRLVEYYTRYNADKVGDVDEILKIWTGRENELFCSLDRKYDTNWTGSNPGPDDEYEDDRSLKLGLGDFIFYSLLVSHASSPESGSYNFTALAICILVIVLGLISTLMLLPVLPVKALPALPISITLGIIFFLLTNSLIVPYLETVRPAAVFL